MPFDGTDFDTGPTPPTPSRDSDAACVVIVLIATIALLAPFSLPAFVDLVRYLGG